MSHDTVTGLAWVLGAFIWINLARLAGERWRWKWQVTTLVAAVGLLTCWGLAIAAASPLPP